MTPIEEHFAFYSELGAAFTNWASVETGLFDLFAACLSKKDMKEASITFFSIENIRSKLDVTSNLVRHKLSKEKEFRLIKDWEVLAERVRKGAGLRNKLAHYQVRVNPYNLEKKRGKYSLAPNTLDIVRTSISGFGLKDFPGIRIKSRRFVRVFEELRGASLEREIAISDVS
jgi:hypothetical protein